MKNNIKFNKIINPIGAEPPLGWWNFWIKRYITINHPVITSQEKFAFKVETIVSPALEACIQTLSIKLISSKHLAKNCKASYLGIGKEDLQHCHLSI